MNKRAYKLLIFYPHNPFEPGHGSHLRALQQIAELSKVAEIHFASSLQTTDTDWPTTRNIKSEYVEDFYIYGRNAFFDPKAYALLIAARLVGRLSRSLKLFSGVARFLDTQRQKHFSKWFSAVAERLSVDAILINYTHWSYLAKPFALKKLLILELHDLIPLNKKFAELVSLELDYRKSSVTLKSPEWESPLTYETLYQSVDSKAISEYCKQIWFFDEIWSIAERETNLLRPYLPSNSVRTVPPRLDFVRKHRVQINTTLVLLPIGPNVFNTYSFLQFLRGIEPSLRYPNGAKISVSGRFHRDTVLTMPENLEYLGLVRNFHALLGQAKFMIAPTRVGTGQQVKIFEALSMGVPVVCYSDAVPEELACIESGVIAVRTPDEFAEGINRLWWDKEFVFKATAGAEAYANAKGETQLYPTAFVQALERFQSRTSGESS